MDVIRKYIAVNFAKIAKKENTKLRKTYWFSFVIEYFTKKKIAQRPISHIKFSL